MCERGSDQLPRKPPTPACYPWGQGGASSSKKLMPDTPARSWSLERDARAGQPAVNGPQPGHSLQVRSGARPGSWRTGGAQGRVVGAAGAGGCQPVLSSCLGTPRLRATTPGAPGGGFRSLELWHEDPTKLCPPVLLIAALGQPTGLCGHWTASHKVGLGAAKAPGNGIPPPLRCTTPRLAGEGTDRGGGDSLSADRVGAPSLSSTRLP